VGFNPRLGEEIDDRRVATIDLAIDGFNRRDATAIGWDNDPWAEAHG
jgi:hypothetical protein